jgi:hypothetical protein
MGDDRYCLRIRDLALILDVDHLRREHDQLIGELSATVEGRTITADLNLSTIRDRLLWAKLLANRINIGDYDWWQGILEDFIQCVRTANRGGQPAVDLRTVPAPTADEEVIEAEGLTLLRDHPEIIFGHGGTAKSYLALYLAGRMAERGLSVGLFDWELAAKNHKRRLQRLFPDGMPRLMYARCERPLIYEVDRLRRIVREHSIEYAVFDSVAFACDGPPEAAEVTGAYLRAVRQIGIGSLHIAHVTKRVTKRGENADQVPLMPFGSVFWHNGARGTWFIEKGDESANGNSSTLTIGLFNQKANLDRRRSPVGFSIQFTEEFTRFRRTDVADSPDLAAPLSVRQRMAAVLRKGAMTPAEVAEEIGAEVETVRREVRRHKDQFVNLQDVRIGLLQKGTE